MNPNVPIGLIHNAIGGTPMESWIPEATLLDDPQLESLVTTPWHVQDHPPYPNWCGERGRENLGKYFAAADGPAPNHPFQPGFLFEAGVQPFSIFRSPAFFGTRENQTRPRMVRGARRLIPTGIVTCSRR